MNMKENCKKISQVIAKAWADAGFKEQLMADPAGTLQAEGIEMPAGVKVNVVENTEQVFYLVVPAAIPLELSDEEMQAVVGGSGMGWPCSPDCCHWEKGMTNDKCPYFGRFC